MWYDEQGYIIVFTGIYWIILLAFSVVIECVEEFTFVAIWIDIEKFAFYYV